MSYITLYNRLDAFAHDTFRKMFSRRYSARQLNDAMRNVDDWKPLSNSQKKEISEYWGLTRPEKSDFATHEVMMNVKGNYDVRYCPEKIYRLYLDPALSDRRMLMAWDDKNYFDRHQPELPFPYTHVRNIDGCFLDHDYRPISKAEAQTIISRNLPLIAKPSLVSGEGKNVRLITDANEVFSSYDKNYLVQELIVQCDELKRMSRRSVSCVRVVTAMVDGDPKFLTAHLLCNTTDSVAVNANAAPGEGVVIICMDGDGRLFDTGYFENAQSIQVLPSGFSFGGLRIPGYKLAVNLALEAHDSMPMFGFIGWDITVDESNRPIIIEWNLRGIEIYHAQLAGGPLFGEYSDYFADMAKSLMRRGAQ